MKIAKSTLQKIIKEEFTNIFKEAVDSTYNQRYYRLTTSVTIDRKVGGEREETLREIRGIPRITTVSVVPETVSKFENKYKMELDIKFALLGTESLKKYQMSALMPGLQKIRGLNILNMGISMEI